MIAKPASALIAIAAIALLLPSCATLPFELDSEEGLGMISLVNGAETERTFVDLPTTDGLYKVYLRTPAPIPDAVKRKLRVKIVIRETGFHVTPVAYTATLDEFIESPVGSIAYEYSHPDAIGGGFLPRAHSEYRVSVRVKELDPVSEEYDAEVVIRADREN